MSEAERLEELRDKYRAFMAMNYDVQILQARAKEAAAAYERATVEENKRRLVPIEHAIDLNDGKIKPAAECKPLKLVE